MELAKQHLKLTNHNKLAQKTVTEAVLSDNDNEIEDYEVNEVLTEDEDDAEPRITFQLKDMAPIVTIKDFLQLPFKELGYCDED